MTQLTLALELITFILSIIFMIYLFKARQRETQQFQSTMNLYLCSILIFLLTTFIELSITLRETFRILILPVNIITTIQPIYSLILYPLFAITLLVGVFLIKERI
ncbi:MAG: hypothetical protein Q7R96_02450 [Nanoarchaeota archaeon]|nr:hypothetical protein [Nanoarchaeota archaeon]